MREPAPDLPLAEPETEARAARFAATLGCSSFDRFRYRDAALHAWIHSLHAHLRSPGFLEECRRRAPAGEPAKGDSPLDF